MKKNIAHVTLSMGQGGIENLLVNLIKHGDRSSFTPFLYCLDAGGELLDFISGDLAGYRIFNRRPGTDWRLIFSLAKAFREDGIDLVHTHNQASFFYSGLAAFIARKPVVINTEHSRHYIDSSWIRRLEKKLLSFVAYKIVDVSEELRNFSVSKDKISERKVTVIENGIDLASFQAGQDKETIKRTLGFQSGDKLVTIVARLDPIKNHRLLLDAFTILARNNTDLNLLIVGDGALRNPLEAWVRNSAYADRVHFLGNRTDVPAILGASDVQVLCSEREGLPLVLLEGMAAKVPLVVSQGANRSGVVQDGVTGFIADSRPECFADTIHKALSGDHVGIVVNQGYRFVAENYSIATTLKNYEQLYLDALG